MSDKPRKNKSKDTLAWEMKQKQEATRKRAFVSDVFFPLLKKHTKSIHQAKQVCKIFQNDIMSTFNLGMQNKVETLDLAKKMDADTSEGADAYRELAKAFEALSITEALELVGGMPEAIDGGMSIDEWTRSLDEIDFIEGTMKLKPKFDIAAACMETECNDLRQLANGTWFAYSKKLTVKGEAYHRGQGATIPEALQALMAAMK